MAIDITGLRVGRITVLRPIGNKTPGGVLWLFRCECGTEKTATAGVLNARRLLSCGCWRDDVVRARSRKARGVSAKNRLIGQYKRGARYRRLNWDLTDEQFFNLTSQPCHYCGIEPYNTTHKMSPHSYGHVTFNGLDRKDNSLGYTITNVVPCCRHCNIAKFKFTYDEFWSWLARIRNGVASSAS